MHSPKLGLREQTQRRLSTQFCYSGIPSKSSRKQFLGTLALSQTQIFESGRHFSPLPRLFPNASPLKWGLSWQYNFEGNVCAPRPLETFPGGFVFGTGLLRFCTESTITLRLIFITLRAKSKLKHASFAMKHSKDYSYPLTQRMRTFTTLLYV